MIFCDLVPAEPALGFNLLYIHIRNRNIVLRWTGWLLSHLLFSALVLGYGRILCTYSWSARAKVWYKEPDFQHLKK